MFNASHNRGFESRTVENMNASHSADHQIPRVSMLSELGSIMTLVANAPVQKRYPLDVLCSRLIPALRCNQYRIYRMSGKPVAFINWAWLSSEKSAQHRDHQCLLSEGDWQSGNELWITELIAERSALPRLIADIRQLFPAGQVLHWHDVTLGGGSQYRRLQLPSLSPTGSSTTRNAQVFSSC